MPPMKTATALKRLGNSKRAMGKLLGISRQAVQHWGENVPPEQERKLRELRPTWFRKPRDGTAA
jgi:hypothetical protein